jgi:HD superfamily phosphohydrolase YqeK
MCQCLWRLGEGHSGQAEVRAMDPNDLIDSIVDAIDYVEIAKDFYGLIKARRLLNNDLRQAIDIYVQEEVAKAVEKPYATLDRKILH